MDEEMMTTNRLTLERAVLNSGKPRFLRPRDFTCVPRLCREMPSRRSPERSAWRGLLERAFGRN